jgi:hypothetical protein
VNEREEAAITSIEQSLSKMIAGVQRIERETDVWGSKVLELQFVCNCLLFAIGKQRALNGAQLREHFLDYAAQFWKPGEAPPLVVNILTALEAGRQQRDAGME